jgi:hypothetical protein
MRSLSIWTAGTFAAIVVAGCAVEESKNPLSPALAGPIPGVALTAPKLLQPIPSQAITTDAQPITLLIENASSNGPRPLVYRFEVAADAAFSNVVFSQGSVPQGPGGRTSVSLSPPLTGGRSYFWRARAEDGVDTGPFAAATTFSIFTPVVIGTPTPVSPVDNVTVTTFTPTFRVANAPRSGPAGPITYTMELADSGAFSNRIAIWNFPEQSNQSTFIAPAGLPPSTGIFWHVRASDPTVTGPWSVVAVFQTPAPPPPPPTGGGGGCAPGETGHVAPGPLSVDRASQVVYGTACEFPQLLVAFPTDSQATDAAVQLLLRTIWHLHLAGFQAGRQRNPSGTEGADKLTIFIDGSWHAYDIFSLGYAGVATQVHFLEVFPPSYVPEAGIPD